MKRDFKHEAWRWKRLALGTWMMIGAVALSGVIGLFGMAATSPDENIALSRNEVVTTDLGRMWHGTFWNHSDSLYTDLDAVVLFVDVEGKPVGQARGGALRLEPGEVFTIEAPIPPEVAKMQVYQLRWTSDSGHRAVLGPFRPWAFGYVMDEACEDWQLKIGACTPAREVSQ